MTADLFVHVYSFGWMPPSGWLLVGIVVWLVAAALVGLWIARMVRQRDQEMSGEGVVVRETTEARRG